MFLRQSTASQEIQLGKFVDDTDGKTAETALSIANTDIKLLKGGATAQASKNSGGATHMANGHYSAALDATDTNTLGNLEVTVDVAGALHVRREYVVLPAVVYDAMLAGTGAGIRSEVVTLPAGESGILYGPFTPGVSTTTTIVEFDGGASATDAFYKNRLIINPGTRTAAWIDDYAGATKLATLNNATPVAMSGDCYVLLTDRRVQMTAALASSINSSSLAANTVTAAAIASDAITAAKIAADAGTEIAAAVWDRLTSALTTANSIGKKLADWALGTDNRVLVSADAHTSNVVVASVSGNVAGNVTGNVTGTVGGFSASAQATLQTKAEDALRTYNLDHLLAAAVDTDLATTMHVNSVLGHLMDDGSAASYDRTTDSLEAQRNRTFAKGTDITGFNDVSTAQVNAEADQALTDYGALRPTVAGRTFDVTATGAGGMDWGNIENVTSVVNFTGTTIGTATAVTNAVTATVSDKTGFKLASDGLDTISTTAPAGVAGNFREMMVQTWRRFFKKSTCTSSELKTYADNGSTVLSTQAVSDDGTTQTQGAAA